MAENIFLGFISDAEISAYSIQKHRKAGYLKQKFYVEAFNLYKKFSSLHWNEGIHLMKTGDVHLRCRNRASETARNLRCRNQASETARTENQKTGYANGRRIRRINNKKLKLGILIRREKIYLCYTTEFGAL